MTAPATLLLYWHTARHLRVRQIAARLSRPLAMARPTRRNGAPTPSLRPRQGAFRAPIAPVPSMTGPLSFVFLNEEGGLGGASGWNDPSRSKLWLYNLHYFQDLTAEGARDRAEWHRGLIERWIAENPEATGNGWEPYPVSLRVVNWIKWHLGGHELGPDARASLAAQTRHLARRLEWHLLGNHLLANAKALIFAGAFFGGAEAAEWLRRGSKIYVRQLEEQVLEDGGHFERSPMYHAIILEDVLDLINLGMSYGEVFPLELRTRLHRAAEKMREWLELMTHPDGRIAFFNDAAFGIAADPDEIERYARRLGLAARRPRVAGMMHLRESGYVRVERGDAVLMADVAPVGPDYLPGHAHADTLSMELSVGAERIVVNGGTSVYGKGPQRQRERATALHSTVEVDGESSSEIWDGFRVARRARVLTATVRSLDERHVVDASHDGYRRLPGRNIHHRTWLMGDDGLTVRDQVSGSHGEAVARFHLPAGARLHIRDDRLGGELRTAGGRTIRWTTSSPARSEASEWHPGFGITVPTQCLAVPLARGCAETIFSW